jgi:hypothetical protein
LFRSAVITNKVIQRKPELYGLVFLASLVLGALAGAAADRVLLFGGMIFIGGVAAWIAYKRAAERGGIADLVYLASLGLALTGLVAASTFVARLAGRALAG